jgi:hypothetical protein
MGGGLCNLVGTGCSVLSVAHLHTLDFGSVGSSPAHGSGRHHTLAPRRRTPFAAHRTVHESMRQHLDGRSETVGDANPECTVSAEGEDSIALRHAHRHPCWTLSFTSMSAKVLPLRHTDPSEAAVFAFVGATPADGAEIELHTDPSSTVAPRASFWQRRAVASDFHRISMASSIVRPAHWFAGNGTYIVASDVNTTSIFWANYVEHMPRYSASNMISTNQCYTGAHFRDHCIDGIASLTCTVP